MSSQPQTHRCAARPPLHALRSPRPRTDERLREVPVPEEGGLGALPGGARGVAGVGARGVVALLRECGVTTVGEVHTMPVLLWVNARTQQRQAPARRSGAGISCVAA